MDDLKHSSHWAAAASFPHIQLKKGSYLLQHGTDSSIMITWYIGQARLFSFQPT